MTLAALRPHFLVRAYTRATAIDAHILLFPVRADRTAIAVLALRPLSLVLAYTRAAAFDALILMFPVLAFLVNPGLCHDGVCAATARDEQPRC